MEEVEVFFHFSLILKDKYQIIAISSSELETNINSIVNIFKGWWIKLENSFIKNLLFICLAPLLTIGKNHFVTLNDFSRVSISVLICLRDALGNKNLIVGFFFPFS